MLRASADATGQPHNLAAVTTADVDPLIPDGRALLDFAGALLGHGGDLIAARTALVDAIGPDGAARASMVTGNFEMMNRLLDATGVPVSARMGEISAELGLPPFLGR